MNTRLLLGIGLLLTTLIGCVPPPAPPPTVVYTAPPPPRPVVFVYRCRASYPTPYGPQVVVSSLPRPQPEHSRCFCPSPPPPPGYPPGPAIEGRAVR